MERSFYCLTLSFFLQYFKPQQDSFKIVQKLFLTLPLFDVMNNLICEHLGKETENITHSVLLMAQFHYRHQCSFEL